MTNYRENVLGKCPYWEYTPSHKRRFCRLDKGHAEPHYLYTTEAEQRRAEPPQALPPSPLDDHAKMLERDLMCDSCELPIIGKDFADDTEAMKYGYAGPVCGDCMRDTVNGRLDPDHGLRRSESL